LDCPSLRAPFGKSGPQTFVTVMVAIDNMTTVNGCLRAAKGQWNEENACIVVAPQADGCPDAGGRAGAIPANVAKTLEFQDFECKGGTIIAFNGWAPHRSGANLSPLSRRAVFLTYNRAVEGNVHDEYYQKMEKLRNDWRSRVSLDRVFSPEEQNDLAALATIPR
jgi:ectoine hydroxylase-related dioxygenase (phytanoyl-CoA dioxygenase family)